MFESITASFSPGFEHLSWQTILLAEILSFVLGAAIAGTYQRTHRGLSWSPSLMQALVLSSPVAAMLMLAIGDNFAAAIGVIGSLAVGRFRTNMRDPRDMIFVFASLGVGVAAGLQAFLVSMIAGICFISIAWLLMVCGFGEGETHDGILRFQCSSDEAIASTSSILRRHSRRFELLAVRELLQGGAMEHAYQIALRRRGSEAETALIADLSRTAGVANISWHAQQAPVEG